MSNRYHCPLINICGTLDFQRTPHVRLCSVASTLGWVAILAGVMVSSACAQFNSTFVTRGSRGQDTLRVDSTFSPPYSDIFCNMQVTIRCMKGPSTADRNLTVVFYAKSLENSEHPTAYHVRTRLAEGQTQVVVDIPHTPIEGGRVLWDVAVFEDGRDIEDTRKKKPNESDFQWNGNQSTTDLAAIAFMADDVAQTDVRTELTKLFPEASDVAVTSTAPGFAAAPTVTGIYNSSVIALATASADWRSYLGYRACVISSSDVGKLCGSYPAVASALREYVGSGGKLIIYGASGTRDWTSIKRLFLFDDMAPLEARCLVIKVPKEPWWKSQQFEDAPGQKTIRQKQLEGVGGEESDAAYPLRMDGIAYDAFVAGESYGKWSWGNHVDNLCDLSDFLGTPVLYPDWLYSSRYQMLRLLETESVSEFDYLNGSVLVARKPLEDLPTPLLSHLRATKLSYTHTLSISSGQDGNWFWRNFISQVGKPPVWVFCGLVALFGALIGPGLLLFTGRMKRRSLMIFLVPALSLIATTSIVLYGVFHEGFDTYLRVTSVESIEPDSKKGFVWSRQNFFSGLPPREGISFDAQTFVRPVSATDDRNGMYTSPRQGVSSHVYLDETQTWQGWLKSRQQQQLLIGYPVEESKMPIAIRATATKKIRVENLTDAVLPLAVLRGEGDNYYFVESLASQASLEFEPVELAMLGTKIARAFAPYRPEPPEELRMGGWSGLNSRRGLGRASNSSKDLFDEVIENYFSERPAIPPFGFAVLCTKSDSVRTPIAGKVSDSIHIVFGVHPW
jgi:hypothetical protein